MLVARLVCACAVAMVSLATGVTPTRAATATDSAAGVIVGVTGHVIVEHPKAPARAATLGMRLDAIDVVVVERGGSAEVYLKGGGLVHLRDATRFAMPSGSDTPARAAAQVKLASGAIAQLESGLWVLNDPQGSLLVSPMRGDGPWESSVSAIPLSPRYEALTEPHAVFVWSGGPAKSRVVVAKRREIVWKSAPTAPLTVLDAGAAFPLAAGEVYTWWLEPETGGPPLTAGVPFRMAEADVLEKAKSLEAELRSSDYLRIAYFAGASSWTRVLLLATRMPESEARSRAVAAAATGLRLDERNVAVLAGRLGASVKR